MYVNGSLGWCGLLGWQCHNLTDSLDATPLWEGNALIGAVSQLYSLVHLCSFSKCGVNSYCVSSTALGTGMQGGEGNTSTLGLVSYGCCNKLSNLKQHGFSILQLWRSEVSWSRYQQGWISSRSSRGEGIFLLFPASRTSCIPWLMATSSSLWHSPSYPFLIKTLWLHLGTT